MLAKMIIKQKVQDLELALSRQEELLVSQKEVLRGLKDLIALEICKPDSVVDEAIATSMQINIPRSSYLGLPSNSATFVQEVMQSMANITASKPNVIEVPSSAIKTAAKKRGRESKDSHDEGTISKTVYHSCTIISCHLC
jgi:hypothetical protein